MIEVFSKKLISKKLQNPSDSAKDVILTLSVAKHCQGASASRIYMETVRPGSEPRWGARELCAPPLSPPRGIATNNFCQNLKKLNFANFVQNSKDFESMFNNLRYFAKFRNFLCCILSTPVFLWFAVEGTSKPQEKKRK